MKTKYVAFIPEKDGTTTLRVEDEDGKIWEFKDVRVTDFEGPRFEVAGVKITPLNITFEKVRDSE